MPAKGSKQKTASPPLTTAPPTKHKTSAQESTPFETPRLSLLKLAWFDFILLNDTITFHCCQASGFSLAEKRKHDKVAASTDPHKAQTAEKPYHGKKVVHKAPKGEVLVYQRIPHLPMLGSFMSTSSLWHSNSMTLCAEPSEHQVARQEDTSQKPLALPSKKQKTGKSKRPVIRHSSRKVKKVQKPSIWNEIIFAHIFTYNHSILQSQSFSIIKF